MKISATKRNLKILEKVFKKAPKTYEEALKAEKLPPIPSGKKYTDFEEESKVLREILRQHEEKLCSCNLGKPCYYSRYFYNEISVIEILIEVMP